MSADMQVDAQVAQMAGRLCLVPPLEVCDAPSPKGSWRCIRSPHPATPDNHVFASPKNKRRS